MRADFATGLGLARSLVVYYAQPWRRRALKRFYGSLVRPGDLAFDIGAHVGNRAMTLHALGAHVVAVEPQPAFARFLARHIVRPGIVLVEAAVGRAPGRAVLHVSSRHPTVSSLSRDWIGKVGGTPGFRGVDWDRTAEVPVTTLDELIARFGCPRFCKIDVEGMEAEILHGLGRAIPVVAIEYLPEAPQVALEAAARLAELGDYRFEFSPGETHRLAFGEWIGVSELPARLGRQGGDLYARLQREVAS